MGLWNLGIVLGSTSKVFSKFTNRSKIGILKCCSSWASQAFPIHGGVWKLWFFNITLDCTSKYLRFTKHLGNRDFWSSLAFIFCQIVMIVFQAGYVLGCTAATSLNPPTDFGTNNTCSLMLRFTQILPNMQ